MKDKTSPPFTNGLGDTETERLALLLEELGEAQQIIGKILRHGYDSRNPNDPASPRNSALLEIELGHVRFAVDLLCASADISGLRINESARRKARAVKRYLHHQPTLYCLYGYREGQSHAD